MSLPLDMAAATHRGMVRQHNEDCLVADAQRGLAVLADGMGGYNAGEVASRMAVDVVSAGIRSALEQTPPRDLDHKGMQALLIESAARANAAIYERGSAQAEFSGMGTTLVVALWHESRVAVGHVGDSRLYRLRDGVLQQLTRDHSLLQEQIERGVITREQARYAPHRNVVTRAIGIEAAVETEVHTYTTRSGDLYLVCSDGLTDMLTDREIREVLTASGHAVGRAAERLVQLANERGGVDNISVILARVGGALRAARGAAR